MSLKDALEKLQAEEQRRLKWEADKPTLIEDWRNSVSLLLELIRTNLKEYEASKALSFRNREIRLSEETLGEYSIAAMSIIAGPATIMLDPVGRMIIGAQGRVDMYRQGNSGEANRIVLLKIGTSPDAWATAPLVELQTLRAARVKSLYAPAKRSIETLTKEVLEQRLEFLLR